jgi:anion-transporting  ArsA/GET3 family ATPase
VTVAQSREGLAGWLEDARVVVCLGHGGVGKTTSAAALAVAAARLGRRVVVLTVDPAARLRDALDLPERRGELHRVPLPPGAPGTLDAILLDAKGLFDELVRRLSPSPALAGRVLENPVYRSVAGAFAGSDAYMALEQLLDLAAAPTHDLIVVDTPPASHALELFDAPERVLALLQSKALEYLEEPTRILGGATSRLARGLLAAVVSALERVTGLTLLGDVSTLAGDFGLLSPRFRERARAIQGILRAATTRYLLVTTAEPHAAADSLAFAGEAGLHGVRCDGVIVNRMLSLDADVALRPRSEAESAHQAQDPWPASLSRTLVHCAQDLKRIASAQREVIDRLRAGLERVDARPPTTRLWLELPALSPAPVDLAGIARLAEALVSPAESASSAA